MLALDTPIQFVKGIGPGIAKTLAEKNILSVEDLLYHLPFRYEDRLHPTPIDSLKAGEMASVIGEVRGAALLRTRSMPIFEMTVGQNLTALKAMWFHGTYLKDKFKTGQMVALYGKVEPSRSSRNFKMIQPQFEMLPDDHDDEQSRLLEVGRITPVYESLGGSRFASRWIRRTIYDLLQELKGHIAETLPEALLARLKLPGREEALRNAHFPPAGTPMTHLQAWSTPAHRRLIFEELFYLELGLELEAPQVQRARRHRLRDQRQSPRSHPPGAALSSHRRAKAGARRNRRRHAPRRARCAACCRATSAPARPSWRLQAMIVAIENGYQAALMAPTEILATQHYLSIRKLLENATSPASGRPYRVSLLTGSIDEDRKRATRGKIYRGETDLVIGTHALIEEKVEFANLGLVVVDEQHRFGVLQRFRLMKKPNAAEPDVLVMTATPIPRTLALSLYGDLDLSVLDELPPGRTPIITRQTSDERAPEVWDFVRKQVAKGHQAYIVYPVIEGAKDDQPELDFPVDARGRSSPRGRSEKAREEIRAKTKSLFGESSAPKVAARRNTPELKSAVEMYESLRHTGLAGLRLGLLHGRLSADDKEVTMRRFQRGEIDVLVATTVIEVGVDVPNATVMVIEHAERFGLAQLHQLRGRVGRGAAKSYCILVTGAKKSPQGEERLAAMVRTQNGFELAELDLQLRGPGEFFGTRQAGLPDFRVANLLRDRALLELAKVESAQFVRHADAEATPEEKARVWARLKDAWQRRYGLVEAG